MRNFSPVSETKKGSKTLATSSGAKFEKQSKHGEAQSYNFSAYHRFGNSSSCITAVKWDAYDDENIAGKAKRYHIRRGALNLSHVHLGNWAELFIWQSAYRDPSWKKKEISVTEPGVRQGRENRTSAVFRAHVKGPS